MRDYREIAGGRNHSVALGARSCKDYGFGGEDSGRMEKRRKESSREGEMREELSGLHQAD